MMSTAVPERILLEGNGVLDLDALLLSDPIRDAVLRCIKAQKEAAAGPRARFEPSALATLETSESRLREILESGEDVHGIATDHSISNVISFGGKNVPDALNSDRVRAHRQQVDALLGRLLSTVFANAEGLSVSASGHFWYPPGAYMGWHTNSRVPGWRVYINYAEDEGKSFFRYRNPDSGTIVTLQDKRWNLRVFRIATDKPLWHTVYSDTNRFSLGYMLHKPVATKGLAERIRRLFA